MWASRAFGWSVPALQNTCRLLLILLFICLDASCNVAKLMMVMIMGFIVRHVFNAILCVAVQGCGVTTLLQRPPNLICWFTPLAWWWSLPDFHSYNGNDHKHCNLSEQANTQSLEKGSLPPELVWTDPQAVLTPSHLPTLAWHCLCYKCLLSRLCSQDRICCRLRKRQEWWLTAAVWSRSAVWIIANVGSVSQQE